MMQLRPQLYRLNNSVGDIKLYKSILQTSILSTALAGAQHDPVTPTMAAWQSHLGVREGLEPLGSDLEG